MRIFWHIFNFPEVTTFSPTSTWSWKTSIFWHFQYSENHRILLEMNCLYFHEFLFKLDACKLIKKILTHTFYFYKKQSLLQALMLFEGAWKIFFENSILLSAPQKFQNNPQNLYFRHQWHLWNIRNMFLHMIYKINKRLRKIGLEK